MAGQSLTVKVKIEGANEILRAFREVPPTANHILKRKTKQVSEVLARGIRAAAVSSSGQSALMAPTVKTGDSAIPAVTAGGTSRVGRNRAPAYKILFGSEFGAHVLRQFRPFIGEDGYWFFRTQKALQPEMNRRWKDMADELVREWTA